MSSYLIPQSIIDALSRAHVSWHAPLMTALQALAASDPGYLPALANDQFLPTDQRLFAAFAQPLVAVRYVLVGEGPYPRAESATGVCFMDGAVGSLWSENGLSKPVNRATSLRNFMKMLLVADGFLKADDTGAAALAPVAVNAMQPGRGAIQTLADLQANLTRHGFLLLNASLVFRPHVAPAIDAKAWLPFLQTILASLADRTAPLQPLQPLAPRKPLEPPTLVLWGKIAEQLKRLPETARFPQLQSEHPYNLTFIRNASMQALFGPMHLLRFHQEK